ncbi:MAG: hypothetical protein SVU69_00925 [Pseudomonadota bacterium]|nr:hypothetical protein [Pseudomonadota bacterium]
MASVDPNRRIRIFFLLLILFFVAATTAVDSWRVRDWDRSLWVVIYPINAEGSDGVGSYISGLEKAAFDPVVRFFEEEARAYELPLDTPVIVDLAPEIGQLPPPPPESRSVFRVALWSLRLRFWSWREDPYDGPTPNVRLFVLYHQADEGKVLAHSFGLAKGRIGVVNAFASRRLAPSNQVIMVHELLHALGATDKYDPETNMPLFPHGYAQPDREPLLPQRFAEIMGGRIVVNADRADIPPSLDAVLIGPRTAREINWTE